MIERGRWTRVMANYPYAVSALPSSLGLGARSDLGCSQTLFYATTGDHVIRTGKTAPKHFFGEAIFFHESGMSLRVIEPSPRRLPREEGVQSTFFDDRVGLGSAQLLGRDKPHHRAHAFCDTVEDGDLV